MNRDVHSYNICVLFQKKAIMLRLFADFKTYLMRNIWKDT